MSLWHDELTIMTAVLQWCHNDQFDSKPTDDDANDDDLIIMNDIAQWMVSPGAGQQADCSDFSQFHSKPSSSRKYTLPCDPDHFIQLLEYVIPLPPPPL